MYNDPQMCPYWCMTDHKAAPALVHSSVQIPVPAVIDDFAGLRATTLSLSLRQDHFGCWAIVDEPLVSPLFVSDISTMHRLVDAWTSIGPKPDCSS